MKRRAYVLLASGVLVVLLGTGLVMQTMRYDDVLAQAAIDKASSEAAAQAYEERISEFADLTATLQAEMDKLLAWRDMHFAQALAAFDEASAAASKEHEGFVRAFQIWSELAQAGDTRANYHLGIMHMYGLGGAKFEQQTGIHNVRIAAQNGYPVAQSLMGFLVEHSDGTMVRAGDELALSWWRKGAEGNHCTAIKRLMQVHQAGELGVQADPDKAAQWQARIEGCNKR